MNLLNQGESSGPSVQPAKRRRGRPRKDPSLKHAEAAHIPVSEVVKEYPPQRADRTRAIECMVGQAVTGVVEATFDSGYLLTVRIGSSNTNLRGVVFKPGHCVPITAENDVAPQVQMIRRNDVHFAVENQGWPPGHEIALQKAAVVPSKRKYAPSKTAPAVPPVGLTGTVVPVVPQPVSYPTGLQTSDHGDADVQMVEPLSMLPPDRSIPVSQIFVAAQPHSSHQVAPGIQQDDDDGSFNKGASEVGQDEKHKPMIATDIDASGSSQTSDIKIEDGKEALKCSTEDSGIVSKQEIGSTNEPFPSESSHPASVKEPLFDYETGRMTELLKVSQSTKTYEINYSAIYIVICHAHLSWMPVS